MPGITLVFTYCFWWCCWLIQGHPSQPVHTTRHSHFQRICCDLTHEFKPVFEFTAPATLPNSLVATRLFIERSKMRKNEVILSQRLVACGAWRLLLSVPGKSRLTAANVSQAIYVVVLHHNDLVPGVYYGMLCPVYPMLVFLSLRFSVEFDYITVF